MRGEGRERSCLTSVLKEASSSELDSSTSGGFLISLDSFSALTFSPLVLPLSLAGFLSEKEEDEVRGEVLGPERRSSSSAPRRDSAETRPRGCSGLGEPRPALPSF